MGSRSVSSTQTVGSWSTFPLVSQPSTSVIDRGTSVPVLGSCSWDSLWQLTAFFVVNLNWRQPQLATGKFDPVRSPCHRKPLPTRKSDRTGLSIQRLTTTYAKSSAVQYARWDWSETLERIKCHQRL